MKYKEYAYTASNITTLEHIISIMPESRRVTRIGLEYMLEKEKQRLEGVPIPPRPQNVHVIFQGDPVADGEGIDANFAGKTTIAFTESTAIVIAAATGDLQDTGGIPHRGLGHQLLTGVTTGSYGFEIELMPDMVPEGRLRPPVSIAETAVGMIQDLLQGTLDATDEDLADLAGRMHPRAVSKVAEFAQILKNNGAQVVIELNTREVALKSPSDVERATERLAARNIDQETTNMDGTLIGLVPGRRFFEFRPQGTTDPIQGRIGQEVQEPYRAAVRYTNREVTVRIRRVQVGRGQPKYTLLEILGLVDALPPR